MDETEVQTADEQKDVKTVPTRPPPPKNMKQNTPVDSKEEKIPPKRPKLPAEMLNTNKPFPTSTVQKHLDELRDLQKHRIRWFYKEAKKWIPFCGKDSLEIESVWQCLNSNEDENNLEKNYKPAVRGKLYEVDIQEGNISPLYWKDDPVPILRGTWFKSTNIQEHWEPIEEKDAKKIEESHQSVLRSMGVGSKETMDNESPVIHALKLGHGYRVDWYDISDVRLVNESTGSRIAQKIGLGGAHKLVRGWHTDAIIDDDFPEINHMVFLVHGIGQLMHQNAGIVANMNKIRESAEKAVKKHFKNTFDHGRVEFFPVEWRTSLKLDEGLIDAITPNSVAGLRKVVNETSMDIMYYTSPYFRNEIIKCLREQLNSIYLKYIEKNPEFLKNNGKVSVISHSLGSVIFHDILINWNNQLLQEHMQQGDTNIADEGRWSWIWGPSRKKSPVESSDQKDTLSETFTELNEQLRKAKISVSELESKLHNEGQIADLCRENSDCSLRFKIENAFNIGSPLGVFLVLKGIKPRDDLEQHILPSSVCSRYFNIYDPADPIAYRIEPLIYEHYAHIPALKINQAAKSDPAKATEDVNKKDSAAAGWIKSWFSSPVKAGPGHAEYHGNENIDLPKGEGEKTEEILKEKKALKYRLDYTLESGFVEYFSAITSHTSYWESQEFARFVLRTIIDGEKTSS